MAVKHLLFDMHKELHAKKTGWQQMLVSGLMHLAIIVKRCLEASLHELGGGAAPSRRKRREDPLTALCGYIHKHLSEDLSLKKIAEVFQISPDHLIRTFKKEKGMTFHQYVLLQRIFESKRMLRQFPEMSLTEIAYSVGFASSSQFSKTFKSVNGQTPSHYRQHSQTEQIL
jgi:transcriptional regulator GlxA family with amidase domain